MPGGTLLPEALEERLADRPAAWLVTGAAGFIGSNLVEALLANGQAVVGLDNFSTGYERNLDIVRGKVGSEAASRFTMIDGDICDRATCAKACEGVDYVLHQAALGSVPRSIDEPLASHDSNVTGFINLLEAAREAGASRFIYAASSATYGDHPGLPKVEDEIGNPLSPYAATKWINEIYADVYGRTYGFKATGLRYFNVFGPRQDPEGAYAAVIPKWVAAMLDGDTVTINGDGETSRDFCYVANAVQANVLAALAPEDAQGEVYNVALGGRTTLNELFGLIREGLANHQVHYDQDPAYGPFREGDVRHSQADISKAQSRLGYQPSHSVGDGLAEALPYYIERARDR